MEKYKIKIYYETGDSFSSEDREECLEYVWTNLEMAKKSLQRIKNHYKVYRDHGYGLERPNKPLPEGVLWNDKYYFFNLELLTDDGKPYVYSAFWTGYFETLYSAEIIIDGDSDMYFSIN